MHYSSIMPTKHVVKQFDVPAYYHVYNRASGERQLFRDNEDREFFVHLLQKHLRENADESDDNAEPVKTYEVKIVAYCLMGTHFHLLLYQQDDPAAITRYMRSIGTTYSMYYNRKYTSKGHVFQSSYRASHINDEAYLAHISRYIHLNPRSYVRYAWSSYQVYIGMRRADWVHAELVIEDASGYAQFVKEWAEKDKRSQQNMLQDYLAL